MKATRAGLSYTTMTESEPTGDMPVIRALAEEVFATLGAGHTESVYHNAMKIGLHDHGLKFETERDILIAFRGRYIGTVRADLIVEGRTVIELKASLGTDSVVNDAEEQCRLYMKEMGIRAGVIIVFPKRVGGKLVVKAVSLL
jgi:GxxExxY protein